MARVLVDSFNHAHRGHVSEDELTSRSYAQSEAGWRRAMAEIAAARAARDAGEALRREQLGDAETLFLLAEGEPGEILGLAVTGLALTDRPGSTVPEGWLRGAGEVHSLYVDVAHQRRGIGRALVDAVAQHHVRAGRERLVIGVLSVNAPARRFYEEIGGEIVGTCQFSDEDGMPRDGTVYGWLLKR